MEKASGGHTSKVTIEEELGCRVLHVFHKLVEKLDRALHRNPKAVGNIVIVAWVGVKLDRLASVLNLLVQRLGKLEWHFTVAGAVMKLNRA